MHDVIGMRKAILVAIDDKIDIALLPPCHSLGFVAAAFFKTKPGKQGGKLFGVFFFDREFNKLDIAGMRLWRQGNRLFPDFYTINAITQINQRTQAILGNVFGRA